MSSLLIVVAASVVLLLASALGQWIPGETTPEGQAVHTLQLRRVTVEVRNAGGVAGMARTATDHLRGAGFDVVAFGNADSFDQTASVVIDRAGDWTTAAAVAEALGIDSVRSDPDPDLYVDVTVRLGSVWSASGEGGPTGEAPSPARRRVVGAGKGNGR